MADAKYTRQIVTHVQPWTSGKLFSLRVSRDPGFDFQPGQFARLGLPEADVSDARAPGPGNDAPGVSTANATPAGSVPASRGAPAGDALTGNALAGSAPADDAPANKAPALWRAYSMVSAPSESELEFYVIVVPDGLFSPRLARLRPGDALYVDKTVFGFLTLDRFLDGETLWLLATGTGLSAYLSLLRDPTARQRFSRIVLAHGVRTAADLAYRDELQALCRQFPHVHYLPIASREALPGQPQARLTTLIADGRLERLAGLPLDPARSRVMLCGNPDMLAHARKLLGERGFVSGRRGIPGNLAVENYW